jgi:hypothetical protein
MVVLAMCAAALWAATGPSTYNVLKLPAGFTPAMDGNLDEWSDSYFIDSIQGDWNVYCMKPPAWLPTNFQMKVYAAHDDINIYFAVKIVRDNVYLNCGMSSFDPGCDNLKINSGGKSTAFYIWPDNIVTINPSCPYALGTTLAVTANATGGEGGVLPAYEFSLAIATFDPFTMGSIPFSVGTEDADAGDGSMGTYLAIGAYYTGSKRNLANPWDNVAYYPTYNLVSDEGGPNGVESRSVRGFQEKLCASPNPFTPSTVLSYNLKNSGSLRIYDVNGQAIRSFSALAGSHKVMWDGRDGAGKSVSSGIYIARVESGNSALNTRLFLTR